MANAGISIKNLIEKQKQKQKKTNALPGHLYNIHKNIDKLFIAQSVNNVWAFLEIDHFV